MIGVRKLIESAGSWDRQNYIEWLSAGFFELAEPSDDGLPFDPLFILPTQEPLGQLHQAIKLMPGHMRGAIHAALRDLLSALTPERSARYCDLAWQLAAGLRPPGGLTDQARHLLSFPEVQEPAWLECVRSVLRGVLAYAKTREIGQFIDDFRVSPLWRNEFAWTYGQYVVRRDGRLWLEFMKSFEDDLSADRETAPEGYRRRLRALALAAGAAHIAQRFMAARPSWAPRFLFRDLTAGPDPIMLVEHRGPIAEIQVGTTRAEFVSPMASSDKDVLELFGSLGCFRPEGEVANRMSQLASLIPDQYSASSKASARLN
jgi:hypothetical protein